MELEGVADGFEPIVLAAVPLLVPLLVCVRVGVPDREAVCEAVRVGVKDADAPRERELVRDRVDVPVRLLVLVRVGETVPDFDEVRDFVAEIEGGALNDIVFVDVRVIVFEGL